MGTLASLRAALLAFKKIYRQSPIAPWVLAFLLLNIPVWQSGAVNSASRFAAMRAMAEDHSFRIDPYIEWSIDWARTPDGHYYSNKAPGPALLGAPIVWVFDTLARAFDNYYPKVQPPLQVKVIVSLCLQAFPFAFLVILFCHLLQARGVSLAGQHFAAIALLFGNTAAIFMNVFFGHAFTACALTGLAYALMTRRFVWAGLAFGLALLSDYSMGLLLLPALLAFLLEVETPARLFKSLKALVLGGIPAAILWIWYHTICFGSPFAIALRFQNPKFIYPSESKTRLWGIVDLHPNWNAMYELLFGPTRGILFTQPWLLVTCVLAVIALVRSRREPPSGQLPRSLTVLGLLGFFALLWANSGFIEWHGGGSAGPRYLCIVFPLFAVMAGILHDQVSRASRLLLWSGLAVAVALRALVYTETILASEAKPIWKHYWDFLMARFWLPPWLSLLFFLITFGLAARTARRSVRAPGIS